MNHVLPSVQIGYYWIGISDSTGRENVYSEVFVHALKKLIAARTNVEVEDVSVI